jgi:hypothetical protein
MIMLIDQFLRRISSMGNWLRKPASNIIPGKPIAMKAKYKGRCSCGERILVGDIIYFDPQIERTAKCQSCGRRDSELSGGLLVKESPASYGQKVVDRINQLKALPLPYKKPVGIEFAILMHRLQTDLLHTPQAETFWLNLARITFPSADLILSDNFGETDCTNCHRKLTIGSRILYCRKSRKSLCLVCCPGKL